MSLSLETKLIWMKGYILFFDISLIAISAWYFFSCKMIVEYWILYQGSNNISPGYLSDIILASFYAIFASITIIWVFCVFVGVAKGHIPYAKSNLYLVLLRTIYYFGLCVKTCTLTKATRLSFKSKKEERELKPNIRGRNTNPNANRQNVRMHFRSNSQK